ncbi:hypothetical protein CA11_22140 [Gimesia maris]|nr:hypothetical protein CA11_22140 [Gimesia maris]
MNSYQEQWWHQAKSDHEAFIFLKSAGIAQCHTLHYLQMVTEKIAKAYLWRSGSPPPRSYAGFVHFLRFLGQIRQTDRERIATLLLLQITINSKVGCDLYYQSPMTWNEFLQLLPTMDPIQSIHGLTLLPVQLL